MPSPTAISGFEHQSHRFSPRSWQATNHETNRMPWFIYILKCSDLSYYIGHTDSLQRRVKRHNAGRGPRYTAVRRPVELVYSEEENSKVAAIHREQQIKKWTRAKKEALISGDIKALHSLSRCQNKIPKPNPQTTS